MSNKLKFLVIWAEPKLTTFMQQFGLFEKFKVIGKQDVLEVTGNVDLSIEIVFTGLRENWEKAGLNLVALVSLDEPRFNFVSDEISVISDGHKWTTVDAILNEHGVRDIVYNEKASIKVIDRI